MAVGSVWRFFWRRCHGRAAPVVPLKALVPATLTLAMALNGLIAARVSAAEPAASAPQPPAAGAPADPASSPKLDETALRRASDAVVGVRAVAVEDAGSNESLGRLRVGSGIVVGADGLVLTIGYLVMEADQIELLTDDGRALPARLVGSDVATGFALLRALVPLPLGAAPMGKPESATGAEPMIVISGGEDASVTPARLAARRPFSGYWEYQIDGALFTVPARAGHSGAGLFNLRGELLGVGSLLVADAFAGLPGNMFVPVDLLAPIIDELQRTGSSAASRRAWMGVNCEEAPDGLRVLRVSSGSPAEAAGVQPGDRIVRIDGVAVASLEALWKTLWAGGPPERDVSLQVKRDDREQTLRLHTVDRRSTFKRALGT